MNDVEKINKICSESDLFLDYLEARTKMLGLEPQYETALYVLVVRSILGAIFQGKPKNIIKQLTEEIVSGTISEAELLQKIDDEENE